MKDCAEQIIMNIAFDEYGNGFPVVLLHAFPLSKNMWNESIKPLTELGFRLILPDLRGFGESDNFADINSMETMARDVGGLLDSLKIEKAIIGGLSMGGYITFNIYRLFPHKCAGLILCDTNSASDTVEKKEQRYELIDKIESLGAQALIENMLPNTISDFTKNTNHELIVKLKTMFAEADPKAAIAALRGMAERFDHTKLLEKINVPTALIFGEEDKITNTQIALTMRGQIENSQLFTIKNAGHYSNLEQPEQFNSILCNFLKDVEI